METAAIAAQQASLQMNVALSMIRKNAQAEETLVNLIAQAAASGDRGQNLDITL